MKNAVCFVIVLLLSITSHAQNRVLALDGIDDGVVVPSAEDLKLSTNHTVCFWMKLPSLPPGGRYKILDRANGTDTAVSAYIFEYNFSGGANGVGVDYGDAQRNYIPSPPWEAQTWYHFAFTHDGDVSTSYINGETSSALNEGTVHRFNDGNLHIGYHYHPDGPNQFFPGLLDEITLWKRCLSADEVKAAMLAGLPQSQADLVAYWNFDDGTADDASPNSHDGTFVGGATTQEDPIPWPFELSMAWYAVQLSIDSAPVTNSTVVFQATTNLLLTNGWTDLTGTVQRAGSEHSTVDVMVDDPKKFYRAIIRP